MELTIEFIISDMYRLKDVYLLIDGICIRFQH